MPALLTLLSVLAAWAFLTILVIGLLLILKPLESTRRYLEKITMGVRAIEQQTLPLGPHAGITVQSLALVNQNIQAVSGQLAAVDRSLEVKDA
jgi:hypothetical protein